MSSNGLAGTQTTISLGDVLGAVATRVERQFEHLLRDLPSQESGNRYTRQNAVQRAAQVVSICEEMFGNQLTGLVSPRSHWSTIRWDDCCCCGKAAKALAVEVHISNSV